MALPWIEQELLRFSRAMIAGELDLVEGCRRIAALAPSLPVEMASAEPITTIRAIESETDGFPGAAQRAQWMPDALRRSDEALAAYLAQVREPLLRACQELEALLQARLARLPLEDES